MSLPQFWLGANRKDLAERALVAKREQAARHTRQCELAAKYHRNLNLLSTQYKNIEDNPSGRRTRVNQESRKEEELRAKRKEKLHHRQQKLKMLLAKENEQYLAELRELTSQELVKDPWNISKLKQQIEELKTQRKEEEEVLRKSGAYRALHNPKLPYLQQFEAQQLQKESIGVWEEQKKELQKQAVEKNSREKQKKEELEKKLRGARQSVEEAVADRVKTKEMYDKSMKQKMIVLENNKMNNNSLRYDLEVLDNYEDVVDNVIQKRSEIVQIQQQAMEKIPFFRPSKEKIRKMSVEVTHRLNMDLTSMNFLCNLFEKTGQPSVSLYIDDVIAAKESVSEKLATEEARNADLQILFEEEAAKLWNEWKRTWDEELRHHEQTMNQVLESLSEKIQKEKDDRISQQENYVTSQRELLRILSEEKREADSCVQQLTEKEELLKADVKELEDKLKKFENHLSFLAHA